MLAGVRDKARRCMDNYMLTNTGFLDMRQRALAEQMLRNEPLGVRWVSYGGYEDAERRVLIFLPEYMEEYAGAQAVLTLPDEDNPLCIIRARKAAGARELAHRDYLGSVLGLGVKREVVGDILVVADGADIIILKELSEFFMTAYGKAGRTELTLKDKPMSEIIVPKAMKQEIRETVASMRLDNMISAVFGISRGKATEAISRGIVAVNDLPCEKADKLIKEGDKLVLRGRGKAIVKEVGGKTRKDRTYIVFERYV